MQMQLKPDLELERINEELRITELLIQLLTKELKKAGHSPTDLLANPKTN